MNFFSYAENYSTRLLRTLYPRRPRDRWHDPTICPWVSEDALSHETFNTWREIVYLKAAQYVHNHEYKFEKKNHQKTFSLLEN